MRRHRASRTPAGVALLFVLGACDASGRDGADGGEQPRPAAGRAGGGAPRDASRADAASMPADAGSAGNCGPAGDCDLFDLESCGGERGCVLLLAADADGGGVATPDDEDAGAFAPTAVPSCVAAGAGGDGDPCDGPADCGPGLDCTSAEGGVCRRYCCELNATAGCPRGQFCRIELRDRAGAATGVGLCDACDGCDVLGADCGDGQGCYPLAAGAGRCSACLPAGATEHGDGCDFANECRPGGACARAGGEPRCHALCAVGASACGGGSCAEVSGDPFGAGVGLCVEPAGT